MNNKAKTNSMFLKFVLQKTDQLEQQIIMKILLSSIAIILFVVTSNVQWQPISEDEYNKVFRYAVSETNEYFPLIFTVTTSFIKDGKVVRKVTEVNENQAPGYYRITRTILADGQETNKYQITYGFGNVFCSDDKEKWTNSRYECFGPVNFYPPRETESIEYSIAEKSLEGKPVKVYRKYTVFPPKKNGEKKEFNEEIATIDSRGFFINVVDIEGTLDPKTVTLKREQSWNTKAKFEKIVPPIQN